MEGLSPELVAVLNGAGYNLLTDVLDLERDDVLKVAGMTPPLAEQLMAFLADLTAEEAGEEGAAE
jgi:N utilization substance protein A